MEIAVACLTLTILGLLTLLFLLHRSHETAAREWARERGTLLTRIQHPQVVVPPEDGERELFAPPERKVDPYEDRIGEVDISDEWLTATDG